MYQLSTLKAGCPVHSTFSWEVFFVPCVPWSAIWLWWDTNLPHVYVFLLNQLVLEIMMAVKVNSNDGISLPPFSPPSTLSSVLMSARNWLQHRLHHLFHCRLCHFLYRRPRHSFWRLSKLTIFGLELCTKCDVLRGFPFEGRVLLVRTTILCTVIADCFLVG